MIRSIDHLVIAVRDLAKATTDYERVGFAVTPGGEHTGGATHNALISFADGAYVELIAFREPDRPQEHRWWSRLAVGEGLVDFALLADSLADEADRLAGSGLALDGPAEGGRVRPDGQRVAWRTLLFRDSAAPLPFLIEDVTARELRVPPGDATRHRLGVDGVAGLTLLVGDLEGSAQAFHVLLGPPTAGALPGIDGVGETRRFSLGGQWIELAQPAHAAAELWRHVQTRGSGPYEIALRSAGAGARPGDVLPVDAAHGARFRIVR